MQLEDVCVVRHFTASECIENFNLMNNCMDITGKSYTCRLYMYTFSELYVQALCIFYDVESMIGQIKQLNPKIA